MKRILKTFLFSGGIYLILLSGLLITQPKSGYSPNIEQILFYYLLFSPLWILIIAIYFHIKNKPNHKISHISNKETLYFSLLFFLFLGFVFNLDYLRQIGCFVQNESIFSKNKFIFLGISFVLLTFGYLKSKHKIGILILILEFLFWTLKSLYYNSSFDLIIPGYFTTTSWILRYVLIAICLNEYKIKTPENKVYIT